VKVAFGRVLKDAGILNFRFHDFRHTFASRYMMSGGNLYTLAKIFGHKDIKMTQRYADLSPRFHRPVKRAIRYHLDTRS